MRAKWNQSGWRETVRLTGCGNNRKVGRESARPGWQAKAKAKAKGESAFGYTVSAFLFLFFSVAAAAAAFSFALSLSGRLLCAHTVAAALGSCFHSTNKDVHRRTPFPR